MKTLQQLANARQVPTTTAWYLSDLGEARGRQALFIKQSPQGLNVLREHALIESAVSSNRIEGVTIEQSRVKAVVLGKSLLHDLDEEEIRGYREALTLIHEQHKKLQVSEKTILQLHRISRANIGDAGKYKQKDSDIIEKLADGRVRVRFRTVSARKTPAAMRALINSWDANIDERVVPPAVAMAAMNLDFLCIHPFRDGNGRVSRLLLLLQCYQLGLRSDDTLVSSAPSRRTRRGITKRSSRARKAGTRANTIPGLTSITFFTSSKLHTASLKSALV